ncbi:GGDEF domain-containing protein [Motiliproteus sp.]|uniref:GGDEF domain-containing protein n=1 Tax=Motiliproteus sp. TaxID=1898955 RepID=UPI003BA8C953
MDNQSSNPQAPVDPPDAIDRRASASSYSELQATNDPAYPTKKQAFIQRLKQAYLFDLLRARPHSKHFRHTRAQYINGRIRPIAFLLALLIPAWIAVDALFLSGQELKTIAVLRTTSGALFLLLCLWSSANHSLLVARLKLTLLVVIPSGFHTAAQFVLLGNGHDSLPAGYHFFPFMIIGLGGIFPLTIFEGALLAGFVVGLYILNHLILGDLFSYASLNDIWLLTLLAVISGWAALTQLSMMMRLYRQAHRDSLTGLANRGSIVGFLNRESQSAIEQDSPLSVILMDLDKFKRINDTYGHAVGDEVLINFSQLLIKTSRAEDFVGRYGGEEFLMVLSGTDADTAMKVAHRLRNACHQQHVQLLNGEQLNYSTSAGVAALKPGETVEQMMKRVDDALYQAKGSGRNCIVLADDDD